MSKGFTLSIYDFRLQPLQRSRSNKKRRYTPTETRECKEAIALRFKMVYPGEAPLTGALKLNLEVGIAVPKSCSKKERLYRLGEGYYHCQKPDLDNLEKTVKDALNGLAYRDDCQVAVCSKEKHWSDDHFVRIELYPVKERL